MNTNEVVPAQGPSPAAMRAAQELAKDTNWDPYNVEEAAEVIDRETGLPQLLEFVIRWAVIIRGGESDKRLEPWAVDFCTEAEALLAKAKGGGA